MRAIVAISVLLAACAQEPPKLLTEIKSLEVRVPIPTPCVSLASLPERPTTALPDPTADIARKAAGASAEVRALEQYAKELRAALEACAKP